VGGILNITNQCSECYPFLETPLISGCFNLPKEDAIMKPLYQGTYLVLYDENTIELFGLHGLRSGVHWAMSINGGTGEGTDYCLRHVPMCPAVVRIRSAFDQQKVVKKLELIKLVVVNSRIAVRLFLDGTIRPEHIKEAKEQWIDTTPFLVKGGTVPAVILPAVEFGPYRFPVCIFGETTIMSNSIAALDEKHKRVFVYVNI
jgi:hypothetical protein